MKKRGISLQDIRHSLLKIMEPHDGRLERDDPSPVRRLFSRFLQDLCRDSFIHDFSISMRMNDTSHIFDVVVQFGGYRSSSLKDIPIYVDFFREPWCGEGSPGRVPS